MTTTICHFTAAEDEVFVHDLGDGHRSLRLSIGRSSALSVIVDAAGLAAIRWAITSHLDTQQRRDDAASDEARSVNPEAMMASFIDNLADTAKAESDAALARFDAVAKAAREAAPDGPDRVAAFAADCAERAALGVPTWNRAPVWNADEATDALREALPPMGDVYFGGRRLPMADDRYNLFIKDDSE